MVSPRTRPYLPPPHCSSAECHVPRTLAQSCVLAQRLAHLTDAELEAYLWQLWAREVADAQEVADA